MKPPPPSDDVWPPPVFREATTAAAGRGSSSRRFELVDVGAPEHTALASIDIETAGPTWWLVDGAASSSHLASRLIADVRVEALREGADTLATRPDCAAIIVDAVRSCGGRDEGKRVEFDL